MIPISPITVDNIVPHIGRPVYAVLNDGTCRVGIIRGCSGGQLYLDSSPRGPLSLASVKGAKKEAAKVRTKAWGYGPYGYGGWGWGWGFGAAAAAIGIAAIAALFLIPFFFI